MKPKPRETRFRKRFILPSDRHHFIGRIYELGIVGMHFDTGEEAYQYADVRYVLEVNDGVRTLVRRVESLNVVADMLWLPRGTAYRSLPISAYNWLTISTDAFLMRYISVVDCAMILVNSVWESRLQPVQVTVESLKRKGVSDDAITVLQEMRNLQGTLRSERNERFHHGTERSFTDDDVTLRIVSLFHHRGSPMGGTDRFGRKVDVDVAFREGLSKLQAMFNRQCESLVCELDRLYDVLAREFESRFVPRFRTATHGLNLRPVS